MRVNASSVPFAAPRIAIDGYAYLSPDAAWRSTGHRPRLAARGGIADCPRIGTARTVAGTAMRSCGSAQARRGNAPGRDEPGTVTHERGRAAMGTRGVCAGTRRGRDGVRPGLTGVRQGRRRRVEASRGCVPTMAHGDDVFRDSVADRRQAPGRHGIGFTARSAPAVSCRAVMRQTCRAFIIFGGGHVRTGPQPEGLPVRCGESEPVRSAPRPGAPPPRRDSSPPRTFLSHLVALWVDLRQRADSEGSGAAFALSPVSRSGGNVFSCPSRPSRPGSWRRCVRQCGCGGTVGAPLPEADQWKRRCRRTHRARLRP